MTIIKQTGDCGGLQVTSGSNSEGGSAVTVNNYQSSGCGCGCDSGSGSGSGGSGSGTSPGSGGPGTGGPSQPGANPKSDPNSGSGTGGQPGPGDIVVNLPTCVALTDINKPFGSQGWEYSMLDMRASILATLTATGTEYFDASTDHIVSIRCNLFGISYSLLKIGASDLPVLQNSKRQVVIVDATGEKKAVNYSEVNGGLTLPATLLADVGLAQIAAATGDIKLGAQVDCYCHYGMDIPCLPETSPIAIDGVVASFNKLFNPNHNPVSISDPAWFFIEICSFVKNKNPQQSGGGLGPVSGQPPGSGPNKDPQPGDQQVDLDKCAPLSISMPEKSHGAAYNQSNILSDIISVLPLAKFNPATEKLVSAAIILESTTYCGTSGVSDLFGLPRTLSFTDAVGSKYPVPPTYANFGIGKYRSDKWSGWLWCVGHDNSVLFDGQVDGYTLEPLIREVPQDWKEPAYLNACVSSIVKRPKSQGCTLPYSWTCGGEDDIGCWTNAKTITVNNEASPPTPPTKIGVTFVSLGAISATFVRPDTTTAQTYTVKTYSVVPRSGSGCYQSGDNCTNVADTENTFGSGWVGTTTFNLAIGQDSLGLSFDGNSASPWIVWKVEITAQ